MSTKNEELFEPTKGNTALAPVVLEAEQIDCVTEFIEKEFGEGKDMSIVHELISEYVHSDVIIAENSDYKRFVTCGMSAREMEMGALMGDRELKRIEILFTFSPDYEMDDEEKMTAANELIQITKYPFRENTFFGPGHTINTSGKFKKKYGYDYFLFFVPIAELDVRGLGSVHFIPLIPIYKEEREWMIQNNSVEWILAFVDKFDDDTTCVDHKREIFIPNK